MASEIIPLGDAGPGGSPESVGGGGVALPAPQVLVYVGGVLASRRGLKINFVGDVSVADDPTYNRVDVNVGQVPPTPGNGVPTPGTKTKRRAIIITNGMFCSHAVNLAGTAISSVALSTINALFTSSVPSYPGTVLDDNAIDFVLALPADMSATPNMTATLYVIGQ